MTPWQGLPNTQACSCFASTIDAMGLPRPVYDDIRRDVDVPVLCCLHVGLLALKYPSVHPDTICSIFAQEDQYKVLKSHHIHKAHMDSYCLRYLAGEDVLQICADINFPPCLLMRRMLEVMLGLSKQRVGDVLKQPALLQSVDAATGLTLWQSSRAVRQQRQQQQDLQQRQTAEQQRLRPTMIKPVRVQPLPVSSTTSSGSCSTNCIQAPGSRGSGSCSGSGSSAGAGDWDDAQALLQRLQCDVVRCVAADRSYSPYCDMAKSLAGLEYEALLYQQLEAAGIAFWREQELRERGLFKTPDALLQVPICIRGADNGWHTVHWLDSKASFGDDRTHMQQLEGQYATYVNRYGPGCVIYWFGFISDLCFTVSETGLEGLAGGNGIVGDHACQQGVDVLLRDCFPALEDILQLPRLVPSLPRQGVVTQD